MPREDERVITLGVAEWNVVLSALQLASSIINKISIQAAQQESAPAMANGLDDVAAQPLPAQGVTAD